ncbi:RICIN domain-containing protein [Streptomyces sp. UNOB3_S3]|uniref:RICIN domain-containing protein n=1 Tax=Streptomyces sp. UNOB3_S3 TaxID=2871682 RepID=UPI001E4D2A31|nr:RICIN domain-containing protein [Streptomyces sp. UNOB3_S3]MCC3773729.1 RICIN domain-containing protein [Streptomyces sp. UNOB3_S3]
MKSHFRLPGILAAAAALLLTSGVTTASATTQQDTGKSERRAQNGADSYGWVRNANSGQCLAVPGASTENGKGLIQWGCGSWRDHYWEFEYAFSSGAISYYRVHNLNSGQCLAVPGASTTAGTQVIQWPCGTWPDHYWGIEYTSNGKRLVNWNSRQCLAIPGASTAQGEKVIQWPCGTWPDHYWNF